MSTMLRFDAMGLIPAIVQDYNTGKVLTLAYMNQESFDISKKEGYTCFYSRSRQELWRKGETSGNRQKIVAITEDCDQDALLVQVIPEGPACHTGKQTCFYETIFSTPDYADFSLNDLYALIQGRKENSSEKSYTSYLFNEGQDKILKKVGEEATEVIIASKNKDETEIINEVADLAYHLLVLLVQENISLPQVRHELQARQVIDKKEKQKNTGSH